MIYKSTFFLRARVIWTLVPLRKRCDSLVSVTWLPGAGRRRRIGCLILIGHFPQKSPRINGAFAERDRQLKKSNASLPSCMCDMAHFACRWDITRIHLRFSIWCRSLSAQAPLIIGLFCGKWPIRIHDLYSFALLDLNVYGLMFMD